jgi:hypothetical protein
MSNYQVQWSPYPAESVSYTAANNNVAKLNEEAENS